MLWFPATEAASPATRRYVQPLQFMAIYVVTGWFADSLPSGPDAAYVRIAGRHAGALSWLFARCGFAKTVAIVVRANEIAIEQDSAQGRVRMLTQLENMRSTYFWYSRPLKQAVLLGVLVAVCTFWLAGLPGLLAGWVYYRLNRSLGIGFVDYGGRKTLLRFRPSIIEGQVIDEPAASRLCTIVQSLADRRRDSLNTARSPFSSPPDAMPQAVPAIPPPARS